MLNTITINDINYLNNRVIGRKPAKMSGAKVLLFKEKAKAVLPVETKPVVETPKVIEKETKFSSNESYQTKLNNLGVTCYNQVLGVILAKAARKLRVDSKVVDNQKYVTLNVAIAPQVVEEKPQVKEETKTFDFSEPLNQEIVNEKPKPSIDDFFKKENGEKPPKEENLAELVNIDEIRRKTELLNQKNENISKIELSIQEAEERREKLKQQLAFINQDLDSQLETTEDLELERTMQLNKIQAEIIKMSELLNQNQQTDEYRKTM